MDKTFEQFFNRRILGAILVGIGNFLRAASDRDPKMRRQRFLRFLLPIVPDVVVRSTVKPESREGQRPGAQINLAPALIALFALAVFFLFVRPRVSTGRRMKRARLWRWLGVASSVAGLVLRRQALPSSRSQPIWLAAAGPVISQVVEETIEKRSPRLARIVSILAPIVIASTTRTSDRPKNRDDHAS